MLKGDVTKPEVPSKGKISGNVKGVGRKQWLAKTMCEPNFNCPFCDAAFVRVDSMQSHLRQHQKLQPELEQEIFSLQQQLLQQQQWNNHPTIYSTTPKRATERTESNPKSSQQPQLLPLTSASKVTYNRKLANTSIIGQASGNKIPGSNKSSVSIQDVPIPTSSITLSSASVASSPTNSETEVTPESSNSSVTLLISPSKAGKTFIPSGADIQALSHDNLHGFSYIAISPPSGNPSTTQHNETPGSSIPAVAAANKNTGDNITLLPGQVSARTVPFAQELSPRTGILGICF